MLIIGRRCRRDVGAAAQFHPSTVADARDLRNE